MHGESDNKCKYKTKTPLNLCILNKNDAVIQNEDGILNEYYRSTADGKIGVLYDVNIEIFDEKNASNTKPVFQTSFVQNVDVK